MKHYDVVICGGGLAGLTLSLQLRKESPKISIAVLEKTTRPLPDSILKVGESTVEIGGHYLSHTLGLKKYLKERHLPKLGLRYFYGKGTDPLEDRPELGASMFSPVTTYQLDRGWLENDLREIVLDAGIDLLEGASLKDIALSETAEPHRIQYTKEDVVADITAQWVVDAMGRRRFLQTRLGLKKDCGHHASSAWFRLKGEISVNDLVSRSNKTWHKRNIEDRYLSTNHLMGHGYWVWLIPLSSGNTSIGIVTQDEIHPFDSYARSYEQALEWLQKHEPFLAERIKDLEPMDFKKMKNYSYTSSQIYSENRWACVGESSIFSDPFYSPGSDVIALNNTLTTGMITADLAGNLTKKKVDLLNQAMLEIVYPDQVSYTRNSYHIFGNTQVASAKFYWDTTYYWSVYAHPFMNGLFSDMNFVEEYAGTLIKFSRLNRKVQQLFKLWAEKASSENKYEFCDLARKRFFLSSAIELLTQPPKENFNDFVLHKYDRFEKIANALFIYAHKQTGLNALELRSEFDKDLNDQAVLLTRYAEKEVAEEMGLFKEFFGPLNFSERVKIRYMRFIATIGKGEFLYSVRGQYIKYFVAGKRRIHLRGLLRLLFAG